MNSWYFLVSRSTMVITLYYTLFETTPAPDWNEIHTLFGMNYMTSKIIPLLVCHSYFHFCCVMCTSQPIYTWWWLGLGRLCSNFYLFFYSFILLLSTYSSFLSFNPFCFEWLYTYFSQVCWQICYNHSYSYDFCSITESCIHVVLQKAVKKRKWSRLKVHVHIISL